MKLPSGSYSVAAAMPGMPGPVWGKASFTTKGGAQQTVIADRFRQGARIAK